MKKNNLFLVTSLTLGMLTFGMNYNEIRGEAITSSDQITGNNKEKENTMEKNSHSNNNFDSFEKNIEVKEQGVVESITEVQNNSTSTNTSGVWGSVSWIYDAKTSTITFTSGGELGEYSDSPIKLLKAKNIVFTEEIYTPKNSTDLFSTGLNSYVFLSGIEYLNTSKTTNMMLMFEFVVFRDDSSKINLDTRNVTNMSYMFLNAQWLNSESSGTNVFDDVIINNLDTGNVTDMSAMFSGVRAKSVKLTNLDLKNVNNMSSMFSSTYISSITLGSLNATNAANVTRMFYNSLSLTSLDIGDFDMENIKVMNDMFNTSINKSPLREIVLPVSFIDPGYSSALPEVFPDQYISSNIRLTENWIYEKNGENVGPSEELIRNYDGTMPGRYVLEQKEIAKIGDINKDGVVDLDDLVALRAYLNTGELPEGVSEEYIKQAGDINKDGVVDLDDFVALRGYLNTGSWS